MNIKKHDRLISKKKSVALRFPGNTRGKRANSSLKKQYKLRERKLLYSMGFDAPMHGLVVTVPSSMPSWLQTRCDARREKKMS